MKIVKIAAAALALCAASVACAAPDGIFLKYKDAVIEKRQSAKINSLRADFEVPEIESSLPLIQAARDGDAERVRELLALGAEVDAHEKDGITALMAASLFSREEAANELLARGADVNASADDGRTPLAFALLGGMSRDFIEKLLDAGAYPERCANDGTSPMMLACAGATDSRIVELLYARGAELAVPNKNGDTPLHFVAKNSSDAAPEIAEFLVNHRAPLQAKNSYGATPLMTAAEISSRGDVVEVLLAADPRVNASRSDGMTPLMLAAGNPTPAALEIARRLADAGANFHATDNFGRTVCQVALSSAHSLEMIRWLKGFERGAAEREMSARLSVQPAVKTASSAGQIVLPPKPESEEDAAPEAENSEKLNDEKIEAADETEKLNEDETQKLNEDETQKLNGEEPEEAPEKEPRVKTLAYESKAQNSSRKSNKNGRENSEVPPLANVDLASHQISGSSLRFALVEKSGTMRPFKKRREMKKAKDQRKNDPVLVPPLLPASLNPTDAAPEIIARLLERGESLEDRDTRGRTALICAVRYNASPLAARALLEAGADPNVAYKKSSLLQLLRYNELMENDDKEELAKCIRAAKKK